MSKERAIKGYIYPRKEEARIISIKVTGKGGSYKFYSYKLTD